jgi:hypothetical protein
MMSPRLRPYAWLGLVAAPLLAVWSLMTIAMVASLSGAPNYRGDPARDVLLPEVAFVASVVIGIACVVVLVRTRKRNA